MLSKLLFVFMALQAGLAVAGNAIVNNHCSYDVWVWSVDQGGSSSAIHVPAGSSYTEGFKSTCNGCGTSMKVSKTNQLVGGAITQFEYSIVNNVLWYDISFVNCASGESATSCPGHDGGVAMNSPQSGCGAPTCGAGSYCPAAAYYTPTPSPQPVFSCGTAGTGMNLNMVLCSGKAARKQRSIAGRLTYDV